MIGGCSVLLEGTSSYVDLFYVAARDFTSEDFSILIWVFPTSSGFAMPIVSNGSSPNQGYELYADSAGKIVFDTHDGATDQTISAAAVLETSKWQHLAIVRTGTSVSIFRNGDLLAVVAGTHANPVAWGGSTLLGAFDGLTGYWPGALDEAAFFNVALTQEQIRELMWHSIDSSTPGLVSLHHLDDGAANFGTKTSTDPVSAVDGQLEGAATWVYDRWSPWVEPRVSASGALAVSSATPAVVPGTLRNFIPRNASRLMLVAQWDFSLTTAGTGFIRGEVFQNGALLVTDRVNIAEPAGAVLSRGSHVHVTTIEWNASTLYTLELRARLNAGGNTIRGSFNTPDTGYALVAQSIDGTF